MKESRIPWLVVILLLIFVAPVGIVLLIIKLSESNTRPQRPPQTWQKTPPPGGSFDAQNRQRTQPGRPSGAQNWKRSQPNRPFGTQAQQNPRPPFTPPNPPPRQAAPSRPTPPPKPRDDMDEKLLALRAVAHTIVTPKMQLKAGDICNTTEKIFDHVRKNPKKREKISRLEQYYLPTTTHLLERYSELEKQPHPGENINNALAKIDDVIDTVDSGFKKQLDQLFSADAMDISADVSVMEQLFAKDGLQEDDFSFNQEKASS